MRVVPTRDSEDPPRLAWLPQIGDGEKSQSTSPARMERDPREEPDRLRKLARELRARAGQAELPGYAESLVRAAQELELRASQLEARL